jgi:N-acetylglucosaminyldiphosphoundecaprenol N-acetyl-beta-D-mannosaminyltransferase
MHHERFHLFDIPVDNVNMSGAVDYANHIIENDKQSIILAVNPEKVMAAEKDPRLLGCLKSAGLVIADGIGVVIAGRIKGLNISERVPGSELMPNLCALAAEKSYGIFLFGAKEDVNAQAAEKLQQMYPGLKIAGRQNGYVSAAEMPAFIDRINASGAKLIFVALGSPRQELWMEEYKQQLKVNILQGVGGTFDVIAGSVKRAPQFFIKLHLEWFYRLIKEPKRIKRQMAIPKFFLKVLRERYLSPK